ncbi:MAG: ComF family protein, partial [Myxococcota bacterium]
ELLLPPACAGCGRGVGAGPLCSRCDTSLPRIPHGHCALCQAAPPLPGSRCCPACREGSSPLAACLAAAPYAGEVARAVQRFKYPRPGILGMDPAPGALLRSLLGEAAARSPDRGQLVVPVPQHPARLRRRGFNPAAELARPLARVHGIRFAPVALERLRDTRSQTGLDRRERGRNVAGAFRVRVGQAIPPLVWLVDDVVTTGATLREAAQALRDAGARNVTALCAARTPIGDGSGVTAPRG